MYYNMDLNLVEERLWTSLYLTPKQFQTDIEQIVQDVINDGSDRERILKAQEMHTHVLIHLEEVFDSTFSEECKAMALREVERHARHQARQAEKDLEKANELAAEATLEHITDSVSAEPVAQAPQPAVDINGTDHQGFSPVLDEPMPLLHVQVEAPVSPIKVNGTTVSIESLLGPSESAPTAAQSPPIVEQVIHLTTNLDSLCDSWATASVGLNVDQLEHINAAAISAMWPLLSSWDRDVVAEKVDEVVRSSIALYKS